MTDPQYIRTTLLDLMAAAGGNARPEPIEYWRRNLATVVGRISKAEVEEALNALEESRLIESELDPLSVRRYRVTDAGIRVSTLTPRE